VKNIHRVVLTRLIRFVNRVWSWHRFSSKIKAPSSQRDAITAISSEK